MTVLAASGDWGLVTEDPLSGERNVLDGTPNILLNINMFAGVSFSPENVTIVGGADGFGPYQISVTLAQVGVCMCHTLPLGGNRSLGLSRGACCMLH